MIDALKSNRNMPRSILIRGLELIFLGMKEFFSPKLALV